MYKVEFYAKVRMAVLQGHQSQREAARYFGIHRETVRKICENATPPSYHRRSKPMSTKLGPFMAFIDDVLKADKLVHFKQRHTARRVFKRLQEEQGYTGGYTLVQEYMHQIATKQKEVFISLVHAPGHAQFDFGQANGIIEGKEISFRYACFSLPHSDAFFVKAFPVEDTSAFLDSHLSAFNFFGGIPLSILYDNTKIAVAKILGDGQRKRTQAFSELQSHYLFEDRFPPTAQLYATPPEPVEYKALFEREFI
jgi:transposase